MPGRRTFLRQTTLTAVSFVFVKPFKGFSHTATNSLEPFVKLSITNFNNYEAFANQLTGSAISSFVNNSGVASSTKSHGLLLATLKSFNRKNTSKTEHIQELNRLKGYGCDAIIPVEEELANHSKYYKELVHQHDLPCVVCAELCDDNNLLPYKIILKGNIKIGLLANNSSAGQNLTTKEIAEKLDKTATILKTKHGCHLTVSVNNQQSDYSNEYWGRKEREVAALTKEIDVIVGSKQTARYAVTYVVRNALHGEVLITYQGKEDKSLTALDISFNKGMEKTNVTIRKIA